MPVYLRPTSLKAALSALAEVAFGSTGASGQTLTVLAGGTDIYPARAARQAWLQPFPRDFLDITAVPELRGIRKDGRAWRIGATTSWSELVATPLPEAFDALKQAAQQVGGRQIQNRGTIGGNIVNASPAADGVPPLMSLDATVEIASARGQRGMPLATFIRGNRTTALAKDELVVAIRIPPHRPSARSVFLKLGARSHLVISIASIALLLDIRPDRAIDDIRLTVGACSAVPTRLAALEAELRGNPLSARLLERVTAALTGPLSPIDDIRASSAYRLEAASILVRRALARFVEEDPGREAA
jgi:CO/xanthine dehydrogenase FAD-binding subunit